MFLSQGRVCVKHQDDFAITFVVINSCYQVCVKLYFRFRILMTLTTKGSILLIVGSIGASSQIRLGNSICGDDCNHAIPSSPYFEERPTAETRWIMIGSFNSTYYWAKNSKTDSPMLFLTKGWFITGSSRKKCFMCVPVKFHLLLSNLFGGWGSE